MPIDPNLYPSLPNPQQRQIERLAALERRMAALESKRDLMVTPVSELTANGAAFGGAGGSMTFPWFGGRLWITLGGRFYVNGTWVEGNFAPTVKINGTNLGPAPVAGWARPNQGGAFGLAAYASPSGVVTGDNTLTVAVPTAAQGTVDRAMLDGLILEWPQA